jgi:hypothetical protein
VSQQFIEEFWLQVQLLEKLLPMTAPTSAAKAANHLQLPFGSAEAEPFQSVTTVSLKTTVSLGLPTREGSELPYWAVVRAGRRAGDFTQ